jgi:hypothetical protein
MNTKVCSCCKKPLTTDNFRKNRTKKDGLSNQCKECLSEAQKKYLQSRPNYWKDWYKMRITKDPSFNKRRYKNLNTDNHREKTKLRRDKFRKLNPNYEKKGTPQYEKVLSRRKKRYQQDELFRLKVNIRNTILRGLQNPKSSRTEEILGCSIQSFKDFIESKFKDGMNWNNQGKNGWELDHIIPLDSAETDDQVLKLNHYTNFQPLWGEQNRKKSNKLDYVIED